MDLKFKVLGRISKPIQVVFEAITDPVHLSKYFTTAGASGRLEAGKTVTWDFADFPGAFPVYIKKVIKNSLIQFEWASAEGGYNTFVEIKLESVDTVKTLVSIAESGWPETQPGLQASYGNCQGWMQMLCCLKVYLEHGFNLRDGFFK